MNPNETLLGGRDIEVTDKKGNALEPIKVKKVSHLKGSKLVEAYGDDAKMVMLTTGKKESELEDLSEDSFYDLLDTSHELNKTSIDRALGSQVKKLENPNFKKMFQQASSLTSSTGGSPGASSQKPLRSL